MVSWVVLQLRLIIITKLTYYRSQISLLNLLSIITDFLKLSLPCCQSASFEMASFWDLVTFDWLVMNWCMCCHGYSWFWLRTGVPGMFWPRASGSGLYQESPERVSSAKTGIWGSQTGKGPGAEAWWMEKQVSMYSPVDVENITGPLWPWGQGVSEVGWIRNLLAMSPLWV